MVTSSSQKQRIVFIEPKSPDSHIFSIYPLPRLGTVMLGTILKNHGFDVDVMVEERRPIGEEDITKGDIIGISTTTSTAPRAYAFATLARSLGKPVVMGGPHVTFRPEEALNYCDYVVRGEAELIVVDLFQRILNSEPVNDIPGVVTSNSDPASFSVAPTPLSLDDLPIPDLGLIRGDNQSKRIFRKRIAPMEASRGCPHDCCFCSVTGMFGRRFRHRSVDHVIEELLRHNKTGGNVFFYDDNLAANRKWFGELLEAMIKHRIRLKWSAQVRVEISRDIEILKLMKRAGCETLFIGIESINPETLLAMNKHQSPDDIREAIKQFRAQGLNVHGMFIMGMDTDTPRSIRETVTWANHSGIHSAQFLILTPFPGTRIYDELNDQGRILFDDWSIYDGHHVTFQPHSMTPEVLQELQVEAHDRFYSRRRTLQRLLSCRMEAAGVFLYARQLQKKWLRTNGIYRDILELMARSHGMIRSVRIEHPARQLNPSSN